MSNLKPCPFCGCDDPIYEPSTADKCGSMMCTGCAANGPEAPTEQGARESWNEQTELTRLRAEHDALVERLRGMAGKWRGYADAMDGGLNRAGGKANRIRDCAADLERLLTAANPDDPIHDKRQQDAEELQAGRRDALRELDDAVNGCDED